MIGRLPTSLDVGGADYPIETDYRNILVFLAACSDPELSAAEKLEILMKRLYRDGFYQIPQEHMEEAILQAKWFVDCGQEEDDKKPAKKVMDWEQDEPILFPAINKVAGMETRAAPYIHWWTFSGYFMEIEEGAFSTVLGIRQKKAKGKKLEKVEHAIKSRTDDVVDFKQMVRSWRSGNRSFTATTRNSATSGNGIPKRIRRRLIIGIIYWAKALKRASYFYVRK